MASLREEKKRATRQAMADAAARLVLDGGAEAATISGITTAVGVSPRTFHNYFSSVADALLSFSTDVLAKFSKEVPTVFPNSSISEFLEQVTLDATENEGKCQMRVFGTGVLGTRYCRVPGSWYRAEGGVGPDR